MDKEIKTYQIDFEKNQSMAFTSPLAYRVGYSRFPNRNRATEYCFARMPKPVK